MSTVAASSAVSSSTQISSSEAVVSTKTETVIPSALLDTLSKDGKEATMTTSSVSSVTVHASSSSSSSSTRTTSTSTAIAVATPSSESSVSTGSGGTDASGGTDTDSTDSTTAALTAAGGGKSTTNIIIGVAVSTGVVAIGAGVLAFARYRGMKGAAIGVTDAGGPAYDEEAGGGGGGGPGAVEAGYFAGSRAGADFRDYSNASLAEPGDAPVADFSGEGATGTDDAGQAIPVTKIRASPSPSQPSNSGRVRPNSDDGPGADFSGMENVGGGDAQYVGVNSGAGRARNTRIGPQADDANR